MSLVVKAIFTELYLTSQDPTDCPAEHAVGVSTFAGNGKVHNCTKVYTFFSLVTTMHSGIA
jgi:hypothetical protein